MFTGPNPFVFIRVLSRRDLPLSLPVAPLHGDAPCFLPSVTFPAIAYGPKATPRSFAPDARASALHRQSLRPRLRPRWLRRYAPDHRLPPPQTAQRFPPSP